LDTTRRSHLSLHVLAEGSATQGLHPSKQKRIVMRRPKRFIVLAAAGLALLICNSGARGQSKDIPPQVIVQMMAARYETVSSYQDSGVVETVSADLPTTRSTDIFFKTYFTRPLKLRFEWMSYSPFSSPERNVVWSDGAKAFGFYSFQPEKIDEDEDVSMALAGATGVSRGAAHTVPELMLKDVGGFSLLDLKKISSQGEERFEGADCYVLEGYHHTGEAWRLWIGKKDLLLRKLRTKSGSNFSEEIHRDIKIEAAIPEATYHPTITAGHLKEVIAKEKEADINRLIDLTFSRERISKVVREALVLMKKAMPQVPEKIWSEVIAELRLDSDLLPEIYVPIYDRLYTAAEIKQMIAFYESPLGQKMARNKHLIDIEAALRGEAIDEEMMKRIQEKLKAKGFGVPSTGDPRGHPDSSFDHRSRL
jgi:hypothetical protein